MSRHPAAAAMFLVLAAAPAVAQPAQAPAPAGAQPAKTPVNGLAWAEDRLTLTLADGDFTVSPLVRADIDVSSFFDQNRPGGFENSANLRRGRLGVRGTVLRDFAYNVTWEFGSYPNRTNALFEAQLAYTGLSWATLRAGAYTPQHMPEFAASSYDLLFLERAAITSIATSLATGDTREAAGIEAHGPRFNASFYVTAGVISTLNSDRQRGLAGRAVVVAVDQPGLQLQLGLDGAAQFEPGTSPGPATLRLRDYPELRGGNSRRFLDTAAIPTDSAYAVGPEVAGRIGPVYVEAVYQHVGVEVTGGGSRGFDGWYAQAAVPLLGPPRTRSGASGTWSRPKTTGMIDPAAGNWGAIEATARYSAVDLRDGATRGGRQRIWTVGANWYLSPNLKMQLQYENGRIDLDRQNRDFQAIGFRAALSL